MLTITYEEQECVVCKNEVEELPTLLADKTRLFWLDLESPTPEEFALLHDIFHFHPIAIEDASRPHQRPKVDEYNDYIFMTVDELSLRPEDEPSEDTDSTGDIQIRQLSLFMGQNYLVTIHIAPIEAVRFLRDRCDRNRRVLERGVDFLLYTLLDALVDGYFPLLETLSDRIDDMEDRLISKPEPELLEAIFRMKRNLTRLRRLVGPLREALQTLTNRDFPLIQSNTIPYLRDVADHVFRIYESLDGYRDLMSNMLDVYLSQVSNDMNRVMQKLSSVATVFLPITFITGIFGMNFTNQPWVNTNFWFWAFFMWAIATFTYWWFHHRRWV